MGREERVKPSRLYALRTVANRLAAPQQEQYRIGESGGCRRS
jgi:hypothetical protein